jgi:hypothetical protein
MEDTQQQNTEANTEGQPETETVEKKPRKARDVTSNFVVYAVENPYNQEITTKRFRASETPIGVIFVKLIREFAPEVALSRVCADDSFLCTWSTKEERLKAVARAIEAGQCKFFQKDSVKIQLNVACVGEELPKEKQPRKAKEPRVAKEKTPREPRAFTNRQPSMFKGLLPEGELDDVQLKFESYQEDGSTAVEIRTFSSKKRALGYAKELGLSQEEAEKSVEKIDDSWRVVQS